MVSPQNYELVDHSAHGETKLQVVRHVSSYHQAMSVPPYNFIQASGLRSVPPSLRCRSDFAALVEI